MSMALIRAVVHHFGLMGGAMQAQGHAQLLLNLLVFGMDIQQAIDAARFRHLGGMNVAIEAAVPESMRAALRRMGHAVSKGQRSQMGDRRRSSDSRGVIRRGRIRGRTGRR